MKAFHALLGASSARRLRDSGLGGSDFRVSEALLHKGPLPVNAIGPKVFLTLGSISTAVNRLHEKRLVSRIGCETDRRVQIVDLTAKGRSLINRIFSTHAKHLEELASVLTPFGARSSGRVFEETGKTRGGTSGFLSMRCHPWSATPNPRAARHGPVK